MSAIQTFSSRELNDAEISELLAMDSQNTNNSDNEERNLFYRTNQSPEAGVGTVDVITINDAMNDEEDNIQRDIDMFGSFASDQDEGEIEMQEVRVNQTRNPTPELAALNRSSCHAAKTGGVSLTRNETSSSIETSESDSDYRYKNKQNLQVKNKKKTLISRSIKGRSKDPVWNDFRVMGGTNNYVQCKRCRTKVSARAYRMKQHLQNCICQREKNRQSTSPVPVSAEAVPTSGCPTSAQETYSSSQVSNSSASGSQTRKIENIKNFVDRVNKGEQNRFDQLLGNFLFSANLPFNVVENTHFKVFVNALRPAYKPPSQEIVGTKILNSCFSRCQEGVKTALKDKKCMEHNNKFSNYCTRC